MNSFLRRMLGTEKAQNVRAVLETLATVRSVADRLGRIPGLEDEHKALETVAERLHVIAADVAAQTDWRLF